MNKLKTKDIVLIALLSALYIVMTVAFMIVCSIAGGLIGHQIAMPISMLATGTIFYFMARKVGKFGQFFIFNAIFMLVFLITSGGHFGAIIASVPASIIADLIASRDKQVPTIRIALGTALLHTSTVMGIVIPNLIYTEKLAAKFAAKGYSPERVAEMVEQSTGTFAYCLMPAAFVLAIIGVYIGSVLLKKHFASQNS